MNSGPDTFPTAERDVFFDGSADSARDSLARHFKSTHIRRWSKDVVHFRAKITR
jgi:hypothetical protein